VTVELAEHPNIQGYKAASGDLNLISEVIERTRDEEFSVLSGDDGLTLPVLSIGGTGTISVVGNVEPERSCAMVGAALSGDYDRARALHHELSPLVRELFAETNPIPVKEAMHIRGRGGPSVRSPLSRLSEDRREILQELLAEYDGARPEPSIRRLSSPRRGRRMSGDSLSIAVTGAGGRMGREVISAAADREGVAVSVAVNRTPTDPVAGSQSRTPTASTSCSRPRNPTRSSTSPVPNRRSRTPRSVRTRAWRWSRGQPGSRTRSSTASGPQARRYPCSRRRTSRAASPRSGARSARPPPRSPVTTWS